MNNIASRPEFLSLLKSLNDCHNKDLSSNISALNCNRRSFSQNDLTPYSFESLKIAIWKMPCKHMTSKLLFIQTFITMISKL